MGKIVNLVSTLSFTVAAAMVKDNEEREHYMKFVVETEVFDILPRLVIGLPIIRGFDNTKGEKESLEMLRETEREQILICKGWPCESK